MQTWEALTNRLLVQSGFSTRAQFLTHYSCHYPLSDAHKVVLEVAHLHLMTSLELAHPIPPFMNVKTKENKTRQNKHKIVGHHLPAIKCVLFIFHRRRNKQKEQKMTHHWLSKNILLPGTTCTKSRQYYHTTIVKWHCTMCHTTKIFGGTCALTTHP